MLRTAKILLRALGRILRDCGTYSQAIAFNLFIAFLPFIVLVLGVVAASTRLSEAVQETLRDLYWLLPPGSRQVVMEFLTLTSHKSRTLLTVGSLGTLFVGTQVMIGFLNAFRVIYRDKSQYSFLLDQLRGLILLILTFAPFLAVSGLTVFGRQLRAWMILHLGLPTLFNAVYTVVYGGLAMILATLTLALLYRVGQPRGRSWNDFLPGAFIATLLWWVVNSAFGYYVRRVPYSVIYGGLAAAIGLAVWMNLSALVVLLGAAFNAEREALRRG
jgi:membrane protein